ncbi:MAG: transposon-encoded TnpW family protein [Lachnospiraceae bacterium]|nr:transposon-encoded TnpW family protein [Lachnospiraceae bacterium]
MTNTTSQNPRTTRRPDCVTEVHMGNTILTVSGYFKQDATDTAADKMMRVLKAETSAQQGNIA